MMNRFKLMFVEFSGFFKYGFAEIVLVLPFFGISVIFLRKVFTLKEAVTYLWIVSIVFYLLGLLVVYRWKKQVIQSTFIIKANRIYDSVMFKIAFFVSYMSASLLMLYFVFNWMDFNAFLEVK